MFDKRQPTGKNFTIAGIIDKTPKDYNGRDPESGEWVELCKYIHDQLVVGGGGMEILLSSKTKVESFRTYLSGYGREYLKSYENGWRFTVTVTPPKNGDDTWQATCWKVAATLKDKRVYSHPKKNKRESI